MRVKLAYILVILIWATTPLSIKLGGESLPPMAGLSLRILLAFFVGSLVCTLGGYAGLNIRQHWKIYAVASVGIFPNMALVYLAAQMISSGLIALLFGLSPFFFAILARFMLGDTSLRPRKLIAIALAVGGLVLIMYDSVAISQNGAMGIFLMLLSNLIFAVSSLWVKKLNMTLAVPPLEQALGAMAFSLPGMLLSWVFVFGVEPVVFTTVSLASLLYLALVASLIGFVGYYYILKHLAAETVSLITLITPVLAMLLGVLVADEVLSAQMVAGASLILLALASYQGYGSALLRKRELR